MVRWLWMSFFWASTGMILEFFRKKTFKLVAGFAFLTQLTFTTLFIRLSDLSEGFPQTNLLTDSYIAPEYFVRKTQQDFMSTQIQAFPHETSQLILNSWRKSSSIFVFKLFSLQTTLILCYYSLCGDGSTKVAASRFCPLMMTAPIVVHTPTDPPIRYFYPICLNIPYYCI